MKRLVALVLASVMVCCLGLPVLAEATGNQARTNAAQSTAYCKYFKSAYDIINTTNIACHNTGTFFSKAALASIEDITVLATLEHPLAISSEAAEALHLYKTYLEGNTEYDESTINTLIRTGIYFNLAIPSLIDAYHALKKPTVPEQYAYADSLLETFITNAQSFCDASVAYMEGTGKMPTYDDTTFELIDIVYDLYVDGYSPIFSN